MPGKQMRGVTNFIHALRNCQSPEQEEERIQMEMAKIRTAFGAVGNQKKKGPENKKNVWKLLYMFMLGYPVDVGQIQSVHLCSSTIFSEKYTGYIACSILLAENNDVLRLIVNAIKGDLGKDGGDDVGRCTVEVALNAVGNIGCAEFAENLFPDIMRLLDYRAGFPSTVKRKSLLCLLRLFRREPELYQGEGWITPIEALMQHTSDIGMLTSAVNLVIGMLEASEHESVHPEDFFTCLNLLLGHLNRLFIEPPTPYIYYGVAAPWFQVRVLRLIQYFPMATLPQEFKTQVNDLVTRILRIHSTGDGDRELRRSRDSPKRGGTQPPASQQKRCKTNAEYAVVFEAINVVIHFNFDATEELRTRTAMLLGSLVSPGSEVNMRYLGLEAMARFASTPELVDSLSRFRNDILDQTNELDISIRRVALNLCYVMCTPSSAQVLVERLLSVLHTAEDTFQQELVVKMAIMAEMNARNFKWYVDIVFKMIEGAPNAVGDDIWYRMVQVVIGFEDQKNEGLQLHAVQRAIVVIQSPVAHATIVKLATYLIGEYGSALTKSRKASPTQIFELLHLHFVRMPPAVQTPMLSAYAKLVAGHPNDRKLRNEVIAVLKELEDSVEVDMQQRACEYLSVLGSAKLMESVFSLMPPFSDDVQASNPLVAQIKDTSSSRAKVRNELDVAHSDASITREQVREGNVTPRGITPRGERGDGSASPRLGNLTPRGEPTTPRFAPGGSRGGDATPRGSADPPWNKLCLGLQTGTLHVQGPLQIRVKHEYQGALGKIALQFVNTGNAAISLHVKVEENPAVVIQQSMEINGAILRAEGTAVHQLKVTCMQPFLKPPRYAVRFATEDGRSAECSPMLPCPMMRFARPTDLQPQPFVQHWQNMEHEERTSAAFNRDPDDLPDLLISAQFAVVREGNGAWNPQRHACCCGAAQFQTHTPDPRDPSRPIVVPVMVKFEVDTSSEASLLPAKITVRSSNAQVSAGMVQLLQMFFLVPAREGATTPR